MVTCLRSHARLLLIVLALLSVFGCAPRPSLTLSPGLSPNFSADNIYVVPFTSTLVPEFFSEAAFNSFVDHLGRERRQVNVKGFPILRDETVENDPAWLLRQARIKGEFWSYTENSGCCSTEIRVKGRASLFEPGKTEPSAEVFLPQEVFFEHDRSTIAREREKLSATLGRNLAVLLLQSLKKPAGPSR